MITNRLLLLCSLCLALLFGGCSTQPQKLPLQQILSVILPPDFTGDYHLIHSDALNVGFDIQFYGLRKVGALWTWTGMVYDGHSPWTADKATLAPGKPAAP